MQFANTVYPCVSCGEEIPPSDKYCRFCGAKQPDRENAVVWNIFSRRKRDTEYHMRYGGELILERGDAVEAFYEADWRNPSSEYYVGSYIASAIPEGGGEMTVNTWSLLGEESAGPDLGEQRIVITLLE